MRKFKDTTIEKRRWDITGHPKMLNTCKCTDTVVFISDTIRICPYCGKVPVQTPLMAKDTR